VPSFSKFIKKLPEFEFMPVDVKRDILRNFMSEFMGDYKNLDDTGRESAEEKVFEFYGIKKESRKIKS